LYQIENKQVLFDWLERHGDMNQRQMMLDWFVDLATDPYRVGFRLPSYRSQMYLALTPVTGAVTLRYLVAEQFHSIRLIEFGRLEPYKWEG
jgi:hypothetical protein